MSIHLRREHEHERRRWRNGGGTTVELAGFPPTVDAGADFDWRVSMADVAQSGAFSRFPGADRVIVLVDGPSMTLQNDEGATDLHPFEPFEFDGDTDIMCEVHRPCRDLNVMTRRGRAIADVEVVSVSGRTAVALTSGSQLLIVGLEGSPRLVGDGAVLRLEAGDTVMSDEAVEMDGGGRVALVRISAATAQMHHDACACGTVEATCPGCGSPRCLTCDPYLSDDCRWGV